MILFTFMAFIIFFNNINITRYTGINSFSHEFVDISKMTSRKNMKSLSIKIKSCFKRLQIIFFIFISRRFPKTYFNNIMSNNFGFTSFTSWSNLNFFSIVSHICGQRQRSTEWTSFFTKWCHDFYYIQKNSFSIESFNFMKMFSFLIIKWTGLFLKTKIQIKESGC